MMNRRGMLAVPLALLATGCAQVTKVSTGAVTVRERLLVDVAEPWNQFERGLNPMAASWTNEGLFVDTLQFFVGIKDGGLIAPTPSEPKGVAPLVFKSSMKPAEVATLFQNLWARDGSTFSVDRIEPHNWLGGEGFRVEFSVVRRADEVKLLGVAWGAIRGGELFIISFTAPRLHFFDRYRPRAEAVARSARLKAA
jgi:hypothetical protein